jgi:hypothetical protein
MQFSERSTQLSRRRWLGRAVLVRARLCACALVPSALMLIVLLVCADRSLVFLVCSVIPFWFLHAPFPPLDPFPSPRARFFSPSLPPSFLSLNSSLLELGDRNTHIWLVSYLFSDSGVERGVVRTRFCFPPVKRPVSLVNLSTVDRSLQSESAQYQIIDTTLEERRL